MKTQTVSIRELVIGAIVVIVFALTSCDKPIKPQQTTQSGNAEIEFLFEKDGCKMYRFLDNSRYIYWCNCEGRYLMTIQNKVEKLK